MVLPAALLLTLVAAGCDGGDQAAAPRPEPVRAVKTAVAVPAQGGGREFAGTVRAAERASLGFPLAGKVAAIEVEVGDLVRRDQVLARLDPVPLELRLRQAQADLDKARAALSAERRRFEAQQALLPKGFTTRRAFDQAQADLSAAENQTESAQAAVRLAQRDLDNTRLLAPFDGRIAERQAQPFADVQAGQAILQLDGVGRLEAVIQVPAEFADTVAIGAGVNVLSGDNRSIGGRVAQIGERVGDASTVPVIVDLQGAPADRSPRPGSTVRVGFVAPGTGDGTQPRGVRIPYSALLLPPNNGPPAVFVVHDEGTAQVARRRSVAVDRNAAARDEVLVTDGLRAGEIVIAAGAAFLTDGQQVAALAAAAR